MVRLAHEVPDARPYLLPLILKEAKEFSTEGALKTYLKDHPGADKSKHWVKGDKGGEAEGKKHDPGNAAPSLAKIPDKVKVEDLPPKYKEEIADYKISVVGDDAKQALEIARKVRKGIDRAADICKMNPSVCEGNKGLSRDKMPQIDGEKSVKAMLESSKPDEVAKGKAMVQAGADPKSDKTILSQMLDHFAKNGVKTTEEEMSVGKMKATQTEIQAGKVFGMADAHLKGKFPDIDASVVVSKDGHILDGHHRWAALLTIDPSRKMKVKKIDMTMDELLKEAASFPGVYKADFSGKPLDEEDQKKYKDTNKSRWKTSHLLRDVVRVAHEQKFLRPYILPIVREYT